MTTERYIERSFPIVQLNPLSVRERNAFKPVYKMHKWFARRSASIFRAILLASALPYEDEDGQPLDLMAEFYRGHGDDPRLRRPDGSPLKVLDPFMGGGTTVVEALRLGFDVTGIDLNPIAWFIVKGETTPVDLDALDAAFDRVADQVRDELLAMYRTVCPVSGAPADIVYGFWVKQGHCVAPGCDGVTDLFKSYEVARKRGDATLRYVPVDCPHCGQGFDWELDRATITAGGPQVHGRGAAGKKRPAERRFAFALPQADATCPHCSGAVPPTARGAGKASKKKVALHVVLDPTTGDFFEVRGGLPDEVTAPRFGHTFDPHAAPMARGGKFVCGACGRQQAVVESADAFGRPLPFRYYGHYAYSPHAADLDEDALAQSGLPTNNLKYFAAATPDDLARIEEAQRELDDRWDELPLPTQEIPWGRNFRDLLRQGYTRWTDLYGPRQLLGLGKLLAAIAREPEPALRDALLGAFQSTLNYQSMLCRHNVPGNKIEGVTAAHDYRNPTTTAENPVFGAAAGLGRGTFANYSSTCRKGIEYGHAPDLIGPEFSTVPVEDVRSDSWHPALLDRSASDTGVANASIDLVITDPPYAGSVQYAEMSDWSYVWLHQVLKDVYPDAFGPELTLKAQEIIEDQGDKDAAWYFEQLTEAWRECHRVLKDDGLLVFTFHHREGDRWTGLLRSLFDAGFYLVAAYPTHSEALNSIVIQATKGITYDIIHVCRKRPDTLRPIPWTRLRRQVQQAARQQLKALEAGGDVLPGPDVWMILLGTALQLFSRHYGQVTDHDGSALDLDEAMERIRLLVSEIRGEVPPLPAALHDVDSLSQVALLQAGHEGWTRDGLHIELRGYAHQPDDLVAAGLVKARGKDGFVPIAPLDRAAGGHLVDRPEGPFIDKLHKLVAETHEGRPVDRWLRSWRVDREALLEGLRWLGRAHPDLKELLGLTRRAVEAVPVADGDAPRQGSLFGDDA